MSATSAFPPANANAVSNDSDKRNARSSRTLKRSTTTSIVCFLCKSNGGGSDRSHTSPSIRARIKPWADKFCRVFKCSPLRSFTIGASSINLLPSGIASTLSTIWLTVCASSGTSWSGHRGVPTRANIKRR